MSSDLFSKCICNIDEPENRGASDSVWWTDQKSQGNVVLHTQKPQGEAQMKHSPDCKHPWSPGQYYFSTSGVLSIFLTVCFQITQCDKAWRKTDSKIFHWSKLKGKKFAPVLEVATKFYTFHIILKKNPQFLQKSGMISATFYTACWHTGKICSSFTWVRFALIAGCPLRQARNTP